MPSVGSYGTVRQAVGDCVTAFDLDGNCLVDALPWADVTEFAIAEEGAREMGRDEFLQAIGGDLPMVEARYLEADGVLMMHDLDADVHRFFV